MPSIRMMRSEAFTLIELLVVVAIIGVLLALLMPAMDRAIYQAELAVCMTNQRAFVNAGVAYSGDHNRFYPTSQSQRSWPYQVNTFVPTLKPYMSVNRVLNCPLVDAVDFEYSEGRSLTIGSYDLWLGWQYSGDKGLKRVGDRMRMTFPANAGNTSDNLPHEADFTVAISDWDLFYIAAARTPGSHPDYGENAKRWLLRIQDQVRGGGLAENTLADSGVLFGNETTSYWTFETSNERGLTDMHFGHTDGSVARYTALETANTDDRLWFIPVYFDKSAYPDVQIPLPKQN